jgi:L-ribulose-5-phosphate 4-epimerase
MKDEGYIKFHCTWLNEELPAEISIKEINACRDKLYASGLIGAYPDGTGYGNISMRLNDNIFLITGTATGSIEHLTDKHFTTVTSYNIMQNTVVCEGPIKASSESLTHAIIYETMPSTNAVIHIHNKSLWKTLIGAVPTTSAEVRYGTPDMAFEMNRLIESTNLINERILVMAGHEDGLIVIGKNLNEALNNVLDYYDRV